MHDAILSQPLSLLSEDIQSKFVEILLKFKSIRMYIPALWLAAARRSPDPQWSASYPHTHTQTHTYTHTKRSSHAPPAAHMRVVRHKNVPLTLRESGYAPTIARDSRGYPNCFVYQALILIHPSTQLEAASPPLPLRTSTRVSLCLDVDFTRCKQLRWRQRPMPLEGLLLLGDHNDAIMISLSPFP